MTNLASVRCITADRFAHASTLDDFIESAQKNRDFWRGVRRTARVAPDLQERARAVSGVWHLLVLAEDWCGDAVNTVPVVAGLIERAPQIDLRVLQRDSNPDIMDAHLTRGSRSIPVVMVLDAGYCERAWWGPRPSLLQAWYYAEGHAAAAADRSRHNRGWYARDRGRSTAAEVLQLLEGASGLAAPGDSS